MFYQKYTSFHYTQCQNLLILITTNPLTHLDFVSETIQDIVKANRIIEVNELPHVVNMANSGKKRLMLDLHYIKKHICKEQIKI